MKRLLVWKYLLAIVITIVVFIVCVIAGSIGFSFQGLLDGVLDKIITEIRIPRVICAALVGAGLSVCGVAMQGLLKNPLADGSTLGVSSGASLGAVIAIVFGSNIFVVTGVVQSTLLVVFAIISAFLSLLVVLALAAKLDKSLSTNTIILVGIVFAMFVSSMISLLVALFPENTRSIMFWTMGSFVGVDYGHCLMIGIFLILCIFTLGKKSTELNILSLGEENASHLGVNVKRTKFVILSCVSALTGVCVAIAGTIGFVGLVVPHISRKIVGPSHGKLMGFSVVFGSVFLMLADLLSRVIVAPKELPIGVITSLVGAVVFFVIFYRQRQARK